MFPDLKEGLLLLAIYEEVRSNLGNIQGLASAYSWPKASVTRFVIQEAEEKLFLEHLGIFWARCCSESHVSSWKAEGIFKHLGLVYNNGVNITIVWFAVFSPFP